MLPCIIYMTYSSLLHVSSNWWQYNSHHTFCKRILSRVKKIVLTFGRFKTQFRSSKKFSTIYSIYLSRVFAECFRESCRESTLEEGLPTQFHPPQLLVPRLISDMTPLDSNHLQAFWNITQISRKRSLSNSSFLIKPLTHRQKVREEHANGPSTQSPQLCSIAW